MIQQPRILRLVLADHTRFATLLGTLALFMFVIPLVAAQVESLGAAPRFRVIVNALLVAAVYAASRSKLTLLFAVGIAGGAFAADFVAAWYGAPLAVVAHHLAAATLLSFTAVTVLSAVLQTDRVTADTILGGICIYLLIGLVYMVMFSMIELVAPGSFQDQGVALSQFEPDYMERFELLVYYSFVTLTTLGYGDVHPVTETAQLLSASEAVLGQIFMTVFIARLVGLHISHAHFVRTAEGD